MEDLPGALRPEMPSPGGLMCGAPWTLRSDAPGSAAPYKRRPPGAVSSAPLIAGPGPRAAQAEITAQGRRPLSHPPGLIPCGAL